VSFAWLEDDDVLQANSAIGSTNDDLGAPVTDTNYRLRFLLDNTGDKDEEDGYILRYSINAGVDWISVTTTSNYVRSVASGQALSDGDATAQRLGSGSFDEGDYDENGAITSYIFAQGQESEHEFCIQFRSADISTETILLHIEFDNTTVIDGYTNTPSTTFTAEVPAPEVADNLAITDAATADAQRGIGVQDDATATDSATADVSDPQVSAQDDVTITDAATADVQRGIDAQDDLTVADSATTSVTRQVSAQDD
ncbi:unnamed protein product, partial [marine sediment metagenome]